MSDCVICLLSSSPDRAESACPAKTISPIPATFEAKRFVEIDVDSSSESEIGNSKEASAVHTSNTSNSSKRTIYSLRKNDENSVILLSSDDETEKENNAPSTRSSRDPDFEDDDIGMISSSQGTTASLSRSMATHKFLDDSESDEEVEAMVKKRRNHYASLLDENAIEDTSCFIFEPYKTSSSTKLHSPDTTTILEQSNEKQDKAAQKKLVRQQEKEAALEIVRQQKATQRSLKSVNTIRQKANTVQEMIVEFSEEWIEKRGNAVLEILQEMGTETLVTSLAKPALINIKRKIDRVWSQETQNWMPCDPIQIQEEPFVIFVLGPFMFAEMVLEGIETSHTICKSAYPDKKIIYLIEDLEKYYQEKKKIEQRRFQTMVSGAAPKLTKKQQQRLADLERLPNKDQIENALFWLEMKAGKSVFVHYSTKEDTPSWIKAFIGEISLIPEWTYRNEESFGVQFGESIKSGKNFKDTWQKMLECVLMMTEAKAEAIVAKYPTFFSLHSTYKRLSQSDGEALLVDLQWNSGVPSKPNYKRIGPVLSKRVYDMMTCPDPHRILRHS